MEGVVIRNTGSNYEVETDNGTTLFCKIKGKFRIKGIRTTNPIAVGDKVEYIMPDNSEDGFITKIIPRTNYIIRKSINLSKEAHIIAANIDNVFLVVTMSQPITPLEFIDRFLVSCELYKIPATIVLNKSDLLEEGEISELKSLYNQIGYDVIVCSTITGVGLDTIKDKMANKISLFSGNSGVGKSSIIKAIMPEYDIKIADISQAHSTGRHTTTFSQMFKIENGGYLVDTPGIKSFGLIDVDKNELCRYFPEMFKYSSDCQFANCTHTHEPKCNIKSLVESGAIPASRYDSYVSMLEIENEKYR